MHRYELSDEQWEAIAQLLPSAAKTGRPRRDTRTTLNGVFWKLCSGAAWRDVPERYGPWRTVNDRFALYRDDGTLDRILRELRLKLDASGHLDYSTWMIDGTLIRASRVASGARKRGALMPYRSPRRSDEAEAGGRPSSTSSAMATGSRWPFTSRRGNAESRRNSRPSVGLSRLRVVRSGCSPTGATTRSGFGCGCAGFGR